MGNIRAWEREDIVEAGKPNAAGWLLPDGHNIHRRYPEVAILIPDTMGRACGGLVRFMPAHVRLPERTTQFRVRRPAS